MAAHLFAKKYLAQNHVVFPVGLKYDEKKSREKGHPCKALDPPPPQGWQQLTMDSVRCNFSLNSLGLVTGPVSGVLAVDINNMDLWKVLLDTLGESEPLTCRSISQRGAVHLLFKVTPALEAVRRKGVFNMKPLGYNDIDILGQGDFLLVPPSSFETPEGRREYKFVEGYSLLDNSDKLMEAPEWLIRVLTRNSAAYNRVRGSYIKQVMADGVKAVTSDRKKRKGPNTSTPVKRARSASISSDEGFTAAEEALIALDAKDRLKEVAKHIKKLDANRAIDRQSWIEVGMAIHHATDGSPEGMELWDHFSQRAGPYDRAVLEYQWESFKNGSGITIGSLIHWGKEDAKAARDEKKRKKVEEQREQEKMKADEAVQREAVKFGVNHTGGDGVFDGWDAENFAVAIKNTMHNPQHRVDCMFSREGAFQQCTQCEWRNPIFGHLAVSQTSYPVLYQQVFNITINNIYNSDNAKAELGWNQFTEDSIVVVEDPETNRILLEALSGTHERVAALADHLYGSKFVFTEKTWYRFDGVLWEKDADKIWIRDCLKKLEFRSLFASAKKAFSDATNIDDQDEKVYQIQSVITKLENFSFKSSVVDELGTEVGKRSKKFLDTIDTNRDLIAFENGVYDLKKDQFRAAEPEDYLTLSVGYKFEAEHDPELEAKVHDFFAKVFPDPQVKEYMLKFLASCLAGHTENQRFHFGHGSGSNGKGVLNNLMQVTLGKYAARMDAEYLCSKSKDSEAATPTLTKLVGRRFVYISEAVDGSKINEQLFKQLCGQDRMSYRPLYREQKDFEPDFKLFMVCNDLPNFNGGQDSMQRRVCLIPFVSSFKDPDEMPAATLSTKPIFVKNPMLNDEIKGWNMTFMHILLDYYRIYKAQGLLRPPVIKTLTRGWINANDPVGDFMEEGLEFGDAKTHKTQMKYFWTGYCNWKQASGDIVTDIAREAFFAMIRIKLDQRQG
ncbi:hypothetical protein HK102_003087, partial [Quaeritorhiza haematococci]